MKKSKDDAETYFAHLDIGSGVKMGGITFNKQGVPHLVPPHLVETFKNSPVFAEVSDPDKTLSPGECAKLMEKEMVAYTVRRDLWRKEHKAEKIALLKKKQEEAVRKKAAPAEPEMEIEVPAGSEINIKPKEAKK